MANPQCENGFVKIANTLMEALARIRIPGEARQVMDLIFRKTYGFNKKEDAITLSQFCLATGIKKPNCQRAINKLIEMNLVIKKDNGNIPIYKINKDFDTWKPLSKKITLSKKIMNVIKKDNKSLSKKSTTKDIKDNITKDKSNVLLKEKKGGFSLDSESYGLSELLFNCILTANSHSRLHAFKQNDKKLTIQRWAKDIDLLIHKDKQCPSLVREVIIFSCNDVFWGPNIQSGDTLRKKWDTLVAQMKRNELKEKNKSEGDKSSLDAAGRALKYL
ncbi:MAG: hypothetical protein A2W22_06960 [Candidatus Levybacteria bacterium RBG_16_35_11]|nr:MAG: hypothetical protein A2W22_06960 [Candidatus Levybacteria bacterium RBG_16_35_11]